MRLKLFDLGNTVCPLCLADIDRDAAASGRTVTLEHVPIKALGGKPRCLTCKSCNNKAGQGIDQIAGVHARKLARGRFPVTVDILGKHDTFMLSPEGRPLTQPFKGFSVEDFAKLRSNETGQFTMSVRVEDPRAVAASSLKSAYLAVFSLLGWPGGYNYVTGDALTAARQQIMEPISVDGVGKYVMETHGSVPPNDIMLFTEPLPCWIVKVADHFVCLPLAGNGKVSQPLVELQGLYGGQTVNLEGKASYPFTTFGAFGTVSVRLPGAATMGSLVGQGIRGNLPSGHRIHGLCIDHSGDWATLLCSDLTRRQAFG